MATILNLTPHPVTLFDSEGKNLLATYEPTGIIARAAQVDEKVGEIVVDGLTIDVVHTTFGQPTDLPEPEDGKFYAVSLVTANAAKAFGRSTDDLLVSSGPVRGDDGRIIGCTRFARV